MFREGRHVQKNERRCENMYRFFIDFSSIFREKNRKKRAKRLNNGFARKKRRKFTFGTPFFSKKTFWGRFLGSLWVPWGLPGRSGSLPESLKIFINFQLRLKVCPDGPPGSSREAPGKPPGTPRAQFWVDFAYQKTSQNATKC